MEKNNSQILINHNSQILINQCILIEEENVTISTYEEVFSQPQYQS